MLKQRKVLLLLSIVAFAALLWVGYVRWYFNKLIYPLEEVRPERVAIVFGARIYDDGRLSSMLRDRVETAVRLYQMGKVEKLLLSGDNRIEEYDEPGRMMDYALARGVPAEALQPDYAGRRTYDTCYRAREIFGLESALLVTQDFHLPRALYTCQGLGLDVVGVAADLHPYSRRSLVWSHLREIPATLVALLDIIRQEPSPVLGEPIPLD